MSNFTKEMQSMLPQWMKMAKDPSSIGAQFLNVFGLEMEDMEDYLDTAVKNMYINSADMGQVDVLYKTKLTTKAVLEEPKLMVSVIHKGDLHAARVVSTVRSMYMADPNETVAILDAENMTVYLRISRAWMEENMEKPIDYVSINNLAHYEYELHHVWNTFDELGLLLGLYRLRGESNAIFKDRILDVFKNPANSTKEGIRNGLARGLGIKPEDIELNELSDPAFQRTMLNEDGTPTKKLVQIAKRTNEILGATWGSMAWDEAYWHSIEEDHNGLDYLPHVWDAPMDDWKDEDFQSGVGDDYDLQVRKPEKLENKRDFKYFVGLRGKQKGTKLVNPEMSFKYKILAKGRVVNESYKPEEFKFTVISAEVIKLHYILRAYKTYYYDIPIKFDNAIAITYDSTTDANCEIVTGQTIMDKETNPFLRIEATLSTTSVSATPSLKSLNVLWEDSAGGSNTLQFTSQADFDRYDAQVKTSKLDIITTTTGEVELGYGEFYYMMETKEDFLQGKRMDNIKVENTGAIKLMPFTD